MLWHKEPVCRWMWKGQWNKHNSRENWGKTYKERHIKIDTRRRRRGENEEAEKREKKQRDAKKKTKKKQKTEGKAERGRHRQNWRRWSDLIQWACLLSWKGNPIIWHFHWPDGALCVYVCVRTEKVGLIRLTDSSHFSAAHSSHLRTHSHTHTCIHARKRQIQG